MLEILIVYLVLGGLTAAAQGRWRLQDLARSTLIWPLQLPELIRGDPSPMDAPALAAWQTRIGAALTSLESAVRSSGALSDSTNSRKLLTTTSHDLTAVARRHAELEAVLQRPENDLAEARALVAAAQDHRRPSLQQRVVHIERLFAAREALETQLEAGLAQVMNLAARLHLAKATGAPVEALNQHLEEIAMAVEGVEEAEEIFGADLSMPPDWSPQLEPAVQPVEAEAEPLPVLEHDPAARERFEETFAPQGDHALVRMSQVSAEEVQAGLKDEGKKSSTVWPLIATILALTTSSLMYRILVLGALEQTSALFIGLPAVLALFVALLPPGRSYTGILLKVTTLLLLLSGVLLAEGFICIIMAAPLFYAVGVTVGVLLDILTPKKPTARVLLISPVFLLSLEGVVPALDSPRGEAVTVSRTLTAAPGEIAASLAAQPVFDDPLPLPLQAGFPRPVSALGSGLEIGDRRLIHFAGGEGKPGALMMEVWSVEPGRVVFGCVQDDSHIAHWLDWKSAEITWQTDDDGLTHVDWTMRYDRALSPAVWFGPTERLAVKIATGYLLDSLLPGAEEVQ